MRIALFFRVDEAAGTFHASLCSMFAGVPYTHLASADFPSKDAMFAAYKEVAKRPWRRPPQGSIWKRPAPDPARRQKAGGEDGLSILIPRPAQA